MNKQVKLTANPTTGKVFTQSVDAAGAPKADKNGEPTGYIRIEIQGEIGLNYNGSARGAKSCLLPMSVAGFDKNKEAYFAGAMFPGGIVYQESIEKIDASYRPLRVPVVAGKPELRPITSGGQQVYRKTFYDATGLIEDIRLSYDKVNSVEGVSAAKPEKVLAS